MELFHIIEQLAASENALWNILDGLKSNTTHASFFCREYWGSSASQAQVSLDKMNCNERLKRQVQQACVLESLSLGVASHLCSGVMQGITVTIRSRLRNLLYYIHENCLVLLDMVCQRTILENQNQWQEPKLSGHCPENLNLDILVRVKRYRRLRRGEHVMALRQHNEMIVNVVRQLCRGATPKRPPLSSRGAGGPGDRSPGVRAGNTMPAQPNALSAVNDVLTARMPLDRLRASTIRSKMLQYMVFRPLLNDGTDPECPWPMEDPYLRYGAENFGQSGPELWFEPLPPMLPNLEETPKLPPLASADTYTLVLDLDETLVHYFELDGQGNYDIRPGMHEFLERMNQLGYEIVIFTAATQDYADWVIDQIDPGHLVHHRLYRQHALPWGPIFVKDLSRLGRDLDRTLILDNVQENFMLQPHNGIFICTWYDDPHDTALFALTPLLDELLATRTKVPEILEKYRDQIPTWAGFDQFSQLGAEYSEFDIGAEDGLAPADSAGATPPYPCAAHPTEPSSAAMTPPAPAPAATAPAPLHQQPQQQQQQQQPAQLQQQHHFQPPQPQPQQQQFHQQPAQAPPVPVLDSHRSEWDVHRETSVSGEDRRVPMTTNYPMAVPPYTTAMAGAEHSAVGMSAASPAAAPYASRYQQPVPGTPPYLAQRPPGGYPQPQMHAVHEAPKAQAVPRPQPQTAQLQAPHALPQGAPRQHVVHKAPAFSATGISGPYQATPAAAPLPASAAMWGHAGMGAYPVAGARRR